MAAESERLARALLPDGAPPRPVVPDPPYERLQLAWALGVLMDNRELVRRLERDGAPHR